MSDYLDNLLARSANQSEVVQPRLVSLFEPLPGVTRPLSGELVSPEMDDREPVPDEIPIRALDDTRPAGEQPRAKLPMPGFEGWTPGEIIANPSQGLGPPGPQQPPAPTAHEFDPRPEPRRLQPQSSSTQPHPPLRSEMPVQLKPDRISEPASAQPIAREQGLSAPAIQISRKLPGKELEREAQSVLEPAVAHTVIERFVPFASPPPGQDTLSPPEVKPARRATLPANSVDPGSDIYSESERPAKIAARPQVRPYAEPTRLPVSPPALEPEPTIQVTIGRIEVRASPAPSTPKKQMTGAPTLSLEDYLRQRKGETR